MFAQPRPRTGLDRRTCTDGRVEWMGAMANRLPMMVVARLIGVPDDDVDQLDQVGLFEHTLLDGLVSADQLAAADVAAIELGQLYRRHFTHAAADPQDNLLGDLALACASGEFDREHGPR